MGKTVKNEKLLRSIYYSLGSPAAYAGIQALWREAKKRVPSIKLEEVVKFLEGERTWTLFKPARHRFPRLRTIPTGLNTDWQCDLCIMADLERENDGNKYLLVCIDVLSRKLHVEPAKSKSSIHMIEAFDRLFERAQVLPHKLYSDDGLEFQSAKMLEYFKKRDILKHVMRSPHLHAGVVERANRTIKGRLYKYFSEKNTTRWMDVIQKIANAINNSVNRTIGMTPNSVTYEMAAPLQRRIYKTDDSDKKAPKFKLHQVVRISKAKGTFEKGYLPNYTDELFEITAVKPTQPPSYHIRDLEGQPIKGVFYEPELVRTTRDTTFRIAEVLKTRKRRGIIEHFVRWVGYSDKHNSWVPETDIVS